MPFARAALAALLGVLAVAAGALPLPAQTLTPLHIVTTPTDTGAQVYYAQELGFFKKAGFEVDIASIGSGAAIATAVASGTYDIGQTSIAALAAGHAKGLPFVIIAPGASYTSKAPTSELVVRAGSPLKTAADLNGKIIAVVGLKGLTQVAVQAWLDANHGTSATAKFVEMGFAQMPAALAADRVDAAFIAEPALNAALHDGAKIIGHPYDAIASNFLVGAWFVTGDYAKAHPDVTRRYAAVMAEASAWANAHRSESAAILGKYTKLAVPAGMVRVLYPEHLVAAEVQPSIDVYVKYGLLDREFPAAELIAPSVDHR